MVQSFSSCHKQLSVALLKPLYLNWDLISIRPQVVCKVSHGKIRERSFHLTQKKMPSTSEELIIIIIIITVFGGPRYASALLQY